MSVASTETRPLGLRERNKRDKLKRIKAAARALFIAKGFDDATMREIALRAGVGLGTIFLYAENKRDLLFLTINDQLEAVTQKSEEAIAPTAPLMDNLLAVAELHYEFFGDQPALSRLVLREMAFYDTGAQARPFQKTRDRLNQSVRHRRRAGGGKRSSSSCRRARSSSAGPSSAFSRSSSALAGERALRPARRPAGAGARPDRVGQRHQDAAAKFEFVAAGLTPIVVIPGRGLRPRARNP